MRKLVLLAVEAETGQPVIIIVGGLPDEGGPTPEEIVQHLSAAGLLKSSDSQDTWLKFLKRQPGPNQA